MVTYGYARVSSKDQSLNRQLDALTCFPVLGTNVYTDHMSGKSFDRPGYQELLSALAPGDTLVVKSIDRLGRNYDEIIEQWRLLTKRLRIDIVVMDMPLLDTRTSERNVTGTFISDIVLQLLSYVAQVERENIKQRQAEGIASARARGVQFGRPPKQLPQEFDRVKANWEAGLIGSREAANQLGVARSTFFKWARDTSR
ncbi:MAG: recombinase family protein [Gordonibacter sp.]|uniref:recombinase family protein n=1 Tax=Gordonibacter sp. TaxID=1968902 RepID=UPI002FC90BE6